MRIASVLRKNRLLIKRLLRIEFAPQDERVESDWSESHPDPGVGFPDETF